VPLYFVSRLAREHVKVVLTGEGADELFLGYNRYRVTAWNERLGRWWQATMPLGLQRAARSGALRAPARLRRYTSRTFVALEPSVRTLFYENFAVFPELRRRQLLADPGRLAEGDPYAEGLRCYAKAPGGTLERLGHADLQTYLVELLMKQDQASMAASIESRVPFLDHDLVEYAAALPARLKVRGWRTKAILRSALADVVPGPIMHRRKMGFPTPIDRWLRRPGQSPLDDLLLGPRAQARGLFDPRAVRRLVDGHRAGERHADRLWLLMNLEVWQRIFLDREDPKDIAA
jgi:asparagine synthase (glutamine-hydrolysing)